MKSTLIICLLASAIQAEQELSLAKRIEENLEKASTNQLYTPPYGLRELGLPSGYHYPQNPHVYYPHHYEYERDHQPLQYHPKFAENEVGGVESNPAPEDRR